MKWEHLFQDHILERGFDYYLDDRVRNLRISDKSIEAVVEGSEDYVIKISLSDGKVAHMFCSCPYAVDGTPCKHIAAVLYEYDDAQDEENAIEYHPEATKVSSNCDSHEPTLNELVAGADPDLIRHFLLETLKNDEKLALRFRSLCIPIVSPEDMEKYKKRINQLIRSYQDRHGFIDYRSAHPFMSTMIHEMSDSLHNIFDNKCYNEAFELASYTFVQVSDVDMDDSDGDMSWFAEECEQWWEQILKTAEQSGQTDVLDKMFDWFTGHLDGSIVDYMEEYVESFLMNHFDKGPYQKKKLAFVDEKIKECDSATDSWSSDFHLGGWLMTRIEMMENAGCSCDELTAFCKIHWNHRKVREWYADVCASRGDTDEEIFTLEHGLSMDSSYGGLVAQYCLRLKELYKKTNRLQDYRNIMWRIIIQVKPGDLPLFREFKVQFAPDEWPDIREKVFSLLSSNASALMTLYCEEALYDRLIGKVLSSYGLQAARQYKKELMPLYPEEYLKKYAEEAERSAKNVANRQHYRELANLLIEMQQIPDGQQKAMELEQHWRSIYGNRRAMMDELNKVLRKKNI